MLESGLDEKLWAASVECYYCCLRYVQYFLEEDKTPYERRFGEPFKGPIISVGAKVEYYPISV